VAAVFLTGFPGFLGSALLPRALARRVGDEAFCLVQSRHLELARRRVAELAQTHPHTAGRITLVVGDITEPGLGLDVASTAGLADRLAAVDEVWHLAAAYDLAVDEAVARRVNVEGTTNVLEFCASREGFQRLHHVSTCYVSGTFAGEFTEDLLDAGQAFLNHYEATKFEAEALVRAAMAGGLPATIYRPGIVVGDSTTGSTQKYDGPYFLAGFLRRQWGVAVVPAVGDIDRVRVSLVPRDFVIEAMDVLSGLDRSLGRTYALTDPEPPTVRELVDTFAGHLGRRVVWAPVPLGLARGAIRRVPGAEWLMGLPAEALDYFASPTTYSTGNTVADLAGTGLACPPFTSYAGRLIDFMTQHPEVDSAAMV
jgi:thioester reductase-like protein